MFEFTPNDGLIYQDVCEARQLGLLRNIDNPLPNVKIRAKYLSFGQFAIPGLGTDLYFPNDPELDGKNCIIIGLDVVDTTTNVAFPLPNIATDGLSATQLKQFVFIASNEAKEQIFMLPLYTMNKRLNNGKICQVFMKDHIWGNCYIQCVDTTGLAATGGIWVNVHYIPRNDN